MSSEPRARVVVISGPSGVGKSVVCDRLLKADPRLTWSVSCTTRPKREGEIEGVSYHFLSRDEFQARIRSGDFVEWAEYLDNFYGTSVSTLQEAAANGKFPVLEIEVQGAMKLMEKGVPGVYVFLAPPDFDELEARLRGRNTEDDDLIERRLQRSREEMELADRYPHRVVNDDLDATVDEILDIIARELDGATT